MCALACCQFKFLFAQQSSKLDDLELALELEKAKTRRTRQIVAKCQKASARWEAQEVTTQPLKDTAATARAAQCMRHTAGTKQQPACGNTTVEPAHCWLLTAERGRRRRWPRQWHGWRSSSLVSSQHTQ